MKNWKLLLATIGIIILFLNCEKTPVQISESSSAEETEINDIGVNYVSYEEVPQFANELNRGSKASELSWASKSKPNSISLNKNDIIVVKDSLGNKTYSVLMKVPETPYNVFYNVIAKQTANGKFEKPFVLRYEIDKDYYSTYVENEREDATFKGKLSVYQLNAFTNKSNSTSKEIFDTEPC